jgi:hypothetical protein
MQNYQPIGYNREEYMHKVNALTYWNYGVPEGNTIQPQLSNLIHPQLWNRSMSVVGNVSGNMLIWDPVPELANLPVNGHPEVVNQQWVRVPVNGTTYSKIANIARVTGLARPLAYGKPTQTAKSTVPVYSIDRTQLASAIGQAQGGSTFFQWVKKQLFGVQKNG